MDIYFQHKLTFDWFSEHLMTIDMRKFKIFDP